MTSPTGESSPNALMDCHPPDLGAIEGVFAHFSLVAAKEAPELRVQVPYQIFREDITKCLEQGSGRPLMPVEAAALGRCFALDGPSALIGWDEFRSSFNSLEKNYKQLQTNGPMKSFTRSRQRLLAARRKGLGARPRGAPSPSEKQQQPVVPRTSSQEIGWHHRAALSAEAGPTTAGGRHAPLRSSDVTKGEGRSLASYYGSALGRCF